MRAVVDCRHTVILGSRSSRSRSSARADPDEVEPERLGLPGEGEHLRPGASPRLRRRRTWGRRRRSSGPFSLGGTVSARRNERSGQCNTAERGNRGRTEVQARDVDEPVRIQASVRPGPSLHTPQSSPCSSAELDERANERSSGKSSLESTATAILDPSRLRPVSGGA
jgi:hypothetical protein